MVMFARFVVTTGLLASSALVQAWPGGKDKKDKEMPQGKDAAELAMRGFAGADAGMIADIMKDMQDPETMKEVEKLMKDKKFQQSVDARFGSKGYQEALDTTAKMMNDPAAMAEIKAQADAYAKLLKEGPGKDGAGDMAMGLDYMRKVASNPGFLNEAMEMLNDPATKAQVEAVMNNPEFAKQMNAMAESPEFKEYMKQAGAEMQRLMNDPEAMAAAQKQMEAMMAKMQA